MMTGVPHLMILFCQKDSETGDLVQLKEKAVAYLKSAIESPHHTRDDYKELLVLSYAFLGAQPKGGLCIRSPGSFHQARWMAKAIYALKIFLFRNQMQLPQSALKAVTDLSLFVSLLYCFYWNEAPIASHAPKNDLNFIKELQMGLPDPALTSVALNAFKRHLWYLSEELVALAFFDSRICPEEKLQMVKNLDLQEHKDGKKLKRLDKNVFTATCISDYVTKRTRSFFDSILSDGQQRSLTFLATPPATWEDDATYQEFRDAVQDMKVVNDTAERIIALATEFNSSLTKDESQKQYLLKVVAKHRKDMPSISKSVFI